MKKLILVILLTISMPVFAIQNQFMLRIGAELSYCFSESYSEKMDDETTNTVSGGGFSAQFGYIFEKYELSVLSYIHAAKINNFELEEGGEYLKGDGTLFMQSFNLVLKRYFNYYPFKYWRTYAGIGPSISFNTIKLRNFTSSTDEYTHNHKITTSAPGAYFAIGIEEHALKKENHPSYIQFSYAAHRPTNMSVIDATDYTKVESIYESESGRNIITHTLMIEAGVLLF